MSGAFDCFKEVTRETFFASGGKTGETFLDVMVRYGNSYQQDKFQAQTSLFGGMDGFLSTKSVVGEAMQVGARNVEAVKAKLKELNIPILAEDTGLNYGRTVIFDPETGEFKIKTAGKGDKVI